MRYPATLRADMLEFYLSIAQLNIFVNIYNKIFEFYIIMCYNETKVSKAHRAKGVKNANRH